MAMNHQYVQYFLEIAQCGNVTKAAEHLYMSTPSLSKYIRAFESELGYRLFVRNNRGVELTEEGRALYESVQRPFYEYLLAYNQATSKSRNQRETIVVAFGDGEQIDEKLLDAFHRFNRKNRDRADLVLRSVPVNTLGSGLLEGECNLSLVNELVVANNAKISFVSMYDSHIQILLPMDHPLADTDEVDFMDLKEEKFIICMTERDHSFSDMVTRLCGFTPYCVFVDNIGTCIMTVAAGFGVTMIPDTVSVAAADRVCRKELRQKHAPTRYCAAWLPERATPLIRELTEMIRDAYSSP